MDKINVPKFGSYKQHKASVIEETPEGLKNAERERETVRDECSRDNSRSPTRIRDKKHSSHRPKKHERKNTIQPSVNPDTQFTRWGEEDFAFVVDRKGDLGNAAYGSSNKYNVPDYHLSRSKLILGDDKRPSSAPQKSLLSHPSYEDRKVLRNEPKYRSLPPSEWDVEDDFVSLRPRKKLRIEPLGTVFNEPGEGQPNARRGSESSVDDQHIEDFSYDVKDPTAGSLRSLEKTSQTLLRLVDENPTSGKAWLNYIRFQDAWLQDEDGASPISSDKDTTRGISKVKLSMYQKARKRVPGSDTHHEELLLGLMNEAIRTLEPTKVPQLHLEILKEVDSMQRDHSRLWLKYFEFVQTNIGLFNYEEILTVFKLWKHSNAKYSTTKVINEYEYQQSLHLILRFTFCMREMGYSELALAVWQTQLEAAYFKPHQAETRKNEEDDCKVPEPIVQSFQEFWESEVPRIGESNAQGWRNKRKGMNMIEEKQSTTLYPSSNEQGDTFRKWAQIEKDYAARYANPGRAASDIDSDDPYHIILASDLVDFIDLQGTSYSQPLIDAFLCFQGLPSLPSATTQPYPWRMDEFLDEDLFQITSSDNMHSLGLLKSLEKWSTSTQTLFYASNHRFAVFSNRNTSRNGGSSLTHADFVDNSLQLLVDAEPNDDALAEYYLAFLLHISPTKARKKAKTLLKIRQSSMRLYNAYAIIQARCDSVETSDRIFSQALNMSETLPSHERDQRVLLLNSWVNTAVEAGNYQDALKHLVSHSQNVNHSLAKEIAGIPTPEQRETSRATLTECYSIATSRGLNIQAMLYIELIALHAYLIQSQDLSKALGIYRAYFALYTTTAEPYLQSLHQAQALLIHHHLSSKRPHQPHAIRDALTNSLAAFPHNSVLLSLYHTTESRFRLDDRIRAHINSTVFMPLTSRPEEYSIDATVITATTAPSLADWSFALASELARPLNLGATPHAIRSSFEHAVASKSGHHAAVIWAAYLAFELDRWQDAQSIGGKSGERATHEAARRAKTVFLRGLDCVPWVKAYAMLAFTWLDRVLDEREKRGVYGIMLDSGMRIRVDFEEWVADAM